MAKLDTLLAKQKAIAEQIAAAKAAETRLKSLVKRLIKRPDILALSDEKILEALTQAASQGNPAPAPQPETTE